MVKKNFYQSQYQSFWYNLYCGISKMATIDFQSSTWDKYW